MLTGIVTQGDLLRALENDSDGTITVLEAGSNNPIVAYPDELAFDAMYRMLQHNIGRMPVVSREDSKTLVGYFNRSSILGAWARQKDEEELREHGWYRRWRVGNSHRTPPHTSQSSYGVAAGSTYEATLSDAKDTNSGKYPCALLSAPQRASSLRLSMLFKSFSAAVFGIDAYLVEVEVDVGAGRPGDFNVVGLPDIAVKESRERIKSALRNCGFDFPRNNP